MSNELALVLAAAVLVAMVVGRVIYLRSERMEQDSPLHTERLKAVQRAQREIAFQAKFGRSR